MSHWIYITRIEKVVKEQLGGNRSIYVGGSQKKGVNVGTSDLDLKIDTPEPMTLDERTKLGQGLENEFGKENVDSDHSIIHVVKGKDISIDIVPSQAEYFPEGFKLEKKGVRPFLTNDRGRHAVRNLKEIDRSVPGIKIEETVLEIQQRSKGISLHDIIKEAETELQKSWSEVANEIEKDVSLVSHFLEETNCYIIICIICQCSIYSVLLIFQIFVPNSLNRLFALQKHCKPNRLIYPLLKQNHENHFFFFKVLFSKKKLKLQRFSRK